jgi:AraC-like DNA-binding protein
MAATEHVHAWRPAVPGVGEVLHARFTEHAYPPHTHEHWALLLVDSGGVLYDLERRSQDAGPESLTVLPPQVPHDGKAASRNGFRKRVVYLDERWLPHELVGPAARRPTLRDTELRAAVAALNGSLASPGDELESESRLALVCERIRHHLDRGSEAVVGRRDPGTAGRLRDVLDGDLASTPSLRSVAADLDASPTHLIRAFSREFGLPPHRYVTGRRVDRARTLLLDGVPAAEVATEVGFYDQAHLTRHFRRMLGVAPGAFAAHGHVGDG